jgi:hypothetical protein
VHLSTIFWYKFQTQPALYGTAKGLKMSKMAPQVSDKADVFHLYLNLIDKHLHLVYPEQVDTKTKELQ